MGLDNVSGGGKSSSILESLQLNTKTKAEPESTPPVTKHIGIPSDIIIGTKVNKGSVPVNDSVTKDFIPNVDTPLIVGQHVFSNVRKLTDGMDLAEAKKVTTNNKIDEVIFKTKDEQLYIAYGTKEDKGALNLDQVQEGYVGKFGNQTAKIMSIDNEVNTVKEGALSPLKSTWASVKESGTTGITKGISEMGATLVAMFVGKSLIQNGITAVSTTEGTVASVAATASGVSGTINTAKNINVVVGEAGKTGKVIISTMGSGLKQVAVGAVIAGAVVGTIAGSMSVYGALAARKPKNDFTTIDMITDPNLAFTEKVNEKKP